MKLTHGRWLGVLVVSTLGASACSRGEAEAPAAGGGRAGGGRGAGGPAIPVTVAQVTQRDVPREITAIGAAEASMIVAIRAQITGTLTKVNFKEGDDVQKGQILFELDRRPLEAALQQMQANLDRDTATAAQAKITADRYLDLLERGIATRDQTEQARTGAAAAAATVEADKAAVENAKVQILYANIPAEVTGRTGQLMVHQGNLIRANDAASLVTINQLTPINVTFSIPEAQLPDLKRFMNQGAVRVEAAAPNETAPSVGTITFVDNAVDLTTGTIKIKGSFPNTDRRLWPGQFLNVVIRLTTDPGAIIVPTAAVQTGQNGSYVFVVRENKTVDLRPVEVNRTAGNDSLIKRGLQLGETVVTDGQLRLVPGSRVAFKNESSTASDGSGRGEGRGRRGEGGEGAGRGGDGGGRRGEGGGRRDAS
jgi:multidrug efflux system membrane fusion protein